MEKEHVHFNVCLGNPPYQESMNDTSDKPVYNYFYDEAEKVADQYLLISPGRFLFNAGKTPKVWNEKMLNDEHLKVLDFEQESQKIFPNADIKGGVAICYRDKNRQFGKIGFFTPYPLLQTIIKKVWSNEGMKSIREIILLQNRFNLERLYADYPGFKKIISSGGKERRIVSSSFEKLSIFSQTTPTENQIEIIGVVNSNNRGRRAADRKYIEDNGNLYNWKVIVPKSNGSGSLGEVLSSPEIVEPSVGYTQSFLGIGSFRSKTEAEAALKYIKSKFLRVLLSAMKITQDNPPEKWDLIPLQDFSVHSDIDWEKSIPEIDKQLYSKYGLSPTEVAFIETNVKEMK